MTRIALSALLLAASLVAPPPATAAASLAETIPDGAVVDQFDGTTLGEDWTVLSPDSSRWSLSGGALRVESLTGDTYQGTNTARNLVDVPAGDFEVVTKLSAPVALDHQSAGLLAWQDWDNYVRAGLAHVGSAGGPVIETDTEVGASFNASFAARPGSTSAIPRRNSRQRAYRKVKDFTRSAARRTGRSGRAKQARPAFENIMENFGDAR
ncbi:beta-xylosidase family glycoside hydrolase [Nonomuraea sp. NPDC003201]